MTREEAKELLVHVLMTYEPRDQYGDFDDSEPKAGQWKLVDHMWQCDQCQYRQKDQPTTNFCPSCGAWMRWRDERFNQ